MTSSYVITRRAVPHLRCGLCQEPLGSDEATVYLDDERCHRACALEVAEDSFGDEAAILYARERGL